MNYPSTPVWNIQYVPNAIVGQVPPPPEPPPPIDPVHQFSAALRSGFRSLTPALIITGIAVGIASGLGVTVGSAVGTYFVERAGLRAAAKRRGR